MRGRSETFVKVHLMVVKLYISNDPPPPHFLSSGPELTIDERSFHMFLSTSLPVRRSVAYLYPRLLPLDQLDPAEPAETLPAPVRSSMDKLHDQGLFLLENGVHMFLWIGLQLAAEMVQDLFGVQSVAQVREGRGEGGEGEGNAGGDGVGG